MSDSIKQEATPSTSATTAKEILAELNRTEKKTGNSGAVPNTLKGDLLDLSEIEAKHPGKEIRFVNVTNVDKVARRIKNGWSRLSEGDGGKQIGNLAVFVCDKAQVANLRAAKNERHKNLLVQFKAEDHAMAERMSKVLRDRHGIDIDPKRLIAE